MSRKLLLSALGLAAATLAFAQAFHAILNAIVSARY
jgi:hypothetical protein